MLHLVQSRETASLIERMNVRPTCFAAISCGKLINGITLCVIFFMPTFKRVNSSDTQVFNYTDSTESRLIGIQDCSFSSEKQITELEQGLRLGKNFSLLGKESNNG